MESEEGRTHGSEEGGPTMKRGDCYESAGRVILDVFRTFNEEGIELVHGIVTGQGEETAGIRFPHAWVERTVTVGKHRLVICLDQTSDMKKIPRDYYYQVGEVVEDELVRYSVEEAAKLMVETQNFGPWDERFFEAQRIAEAMIKKRE